MSFDVKPLINSTLNKSFHSDVHIAFGIFNIFANIIKITLQPFIRIFKSDNEKQNKIEIRNQFKH